MISLDLASPTPSEFCPCEDTNDRYIVDHLAKKGFVAALPDFYQSVGIEAWPSDKGVYSVEKW